MKGTSKMPSKTGAHRERARERGSKQQHTNSTRRGALPTHATNPSQPFAPTAHTHISPIGEAHVNIFRRGLNSVSQHGMEAHRKTVMGYSDMTCILVCVCVRVRIYVHVCKCA